MCKNKFWVGCKYMYVKINTLEESKRIFLWLWRRQSLLKQGMAILTVKEKIKEVEQLDYLSTTDGSINQYIYYGILFNNIS